MKQKQIVRNIAFVGVFTLGLSLFSGGVMASPLIPPPENDSPPERPDWETDRPERPEEPEPPAERPDRPERPGEPEPPAERPKEQDSVDQPASPSPGDDKDEGATDSDSAGNDGDGDANQSQKSEMGEKMVKTGSDTSSIALMGSGLFVMGLSLVIRFRKVLTI